MIDSQNITKLYESIIQYSVLIHQSFMYNAEHQKYIYIFLNGENMKQFTFLGETIYIPYEEGANPLEYQGCLFLATLLYTIIKNSIKAINVKLMTMD